jgi:HSP20 family protein
MAESKGSASTHEQGRQQHPEGGRQTTQGLQTRSPQSGWGLQRRDQRDPMGEPWTSPFQFMRRMTDEMDRVFDRVFGDFGGLRSMAAPATGYGEMYAHHEPWSPRIEAFQQDSRFIVRAELPGLKKEDVTVNVTDQMLVVEGQRKSEHEENREGFYHTERSYGRFYRSIPLPEGTIAESAEARFNDGVLEITLQTPPNDVRRGRKVEIK